jgi:hypothetical protein
MREINFIINMNMMMMNSKMKDNLIEVLDHLPRSIIFIKISDFKFKYLKYIQ